jgi:peptidoglycan DL-endopeptidase CwlO
VTPDGVFGPRTSAAVRAFQKAHGIPTTGNVGPLTWTALARLARGGSW